MRKLLSRDLSALLGATRAAVLEAIADGGSTTDLAQRLGISPSSASEHAAVLRGAGLVVSARSRNQVRHRLTPLGAALLGIEVVAERVLAGPASAGIRPPGGWRAPSPTLRRHTPSLCPTPAP